MAVVLLAAYVQDTKIEQEVKDVLQVREDYVEHAPERRYTQ